MDESQIHGAKWREQDAKDCIPHDSTYTASAEGKVLGLKNRSIVAHRKAGESWLQGSTGGFGGGDTVFKCAVGYVTIYVCQNLQWSERCSVMSDSLWPHGLYSPWNSPGQNTAVSSHSLLQGIFPTQGLNPSFLHCRRILYQLSHQGNPKTAELYPLKSEFYSM